MIKRFNSLKAHLNKIGFFPTIKYLLQRLFKKKGELIDIKIKGLSHPIYLRNKFYDTNIFYQIFIREELDFNLKITPKTIIDCGANIGLSSLYFKMKYPLCKIYSIEPELSNFKMLELNTKSYKDIIQINAAVWHDSGEIYIIDNGEGHASFTTSNNAGAKNIIGKIPAITIPELLVSNSIKRINLLKMDIEGSELEIFNKDAIVWLNKIESLAIEIHETFRPGVTKIINNMMDTDFSKERNGEYTFYTIRHLDHKC